MKNVLFQPQNFGGFTFFMLLSGMFLGYTTRSHWWYIFASIILFFAGVYFYAKDNK